MVTDQDRALAELILDPSLSEDFGLIPTTINGVDCAVIAYATFCDEHGLSLRPVAVLLNDELFEHLTPPSDATITHFGEPE